MTFILFMKQTFLHPLLFLFVHVNYGTLQLNCNGLYETALRTMLIVGLLPSYFWRDFEIL